MLTYHDKLKNLLSLNIELDGEFSKSAVLQQLPHPNLIFSQIAWHIETQAGQSKRERHCIDI